MAPLVRLYHFYIDSFKGLSNEVWILALITFVNRAGTMVVPFLTLYLTADMGLDLSQVGWVMSSFGCGSVLGSWIGGKLTDKLGHRRVMLGALISSGSAFILLQFAHSFESFCASIFVLMVFADAFRPAIFVALRDYSTKENRTRAVTLIRLAINLGFSMGPAIGGFIITTWSYSGLFWLDGLTCFCAAILMLLTLPVKMSLKEDMSQEQVSEQRSPYSDRPFLIFLFASMLISVPFLQYFSTVPLFYHEVHHMSEFQIGLIMGFNGLLIFLVEMPLIKWIEQRKFELFPILVFSVVLFILSFLMFQLGPFVFLLWVGMFFMTVGEMVNFPFMNRFAYDRSDQGPPGAYMALFSISWSIAHIFGHTLGLRLVDMYGYEFTWYVCIAFLVAAILMLVVMKREVKREDVVSELLEE